MIGDAILPAIRARLAGALGQAHPRYRPLIVDGVTAGWLDDMRAARLAEIATMFRIAPDGVVLAADLRTADSRSAAFAEVAQTLRREGALPGWRDELYAVAPAFGVAPLFVLERGAARWFGVHTWAAHVNGIVRSSGAPRMWLSRRSPHKAVDPGMLDNLVGGGIAGGMRVDATLVKESWEEAGIPADLARRAVPVGAVHIRRAHPDGLQRETMFVHDLDVPESFRPANQDGEAVEHRLVDLAEAATLIAAPSGRDEVTVDASLVILDFLLRHGAIAADSQDYLCLEALRHAGADR